MRKKISYQDRTLWRKVGYSLLVVVVSVVLSHIPVYGVNSTYMKGLFSNVSLLSFSDALTGGGLSQLAVGGFGVTGIIMAGILIQLVSILFPKVERIRSDGEAGRRMFERIEFILAMVLTAVIGCMIAVTMSSSEMYSIPHRWMAGISVAEWLMGTAIIAGLAHGVERHGIGNGPTLVLAANIAMTVPQTISTWVQAGVGMKSVAIIVIAFFIVLVLAILLQGGVIRIPVQNPRKDRSSMNVSGEIPVPVAASSVLPVVYATSIMMVPTIIKLWVDVPWLNTLADACAQTNWYSPVAWYHWAGLVAYLLMVFWFSFYASRMTFSSEEIANRMLERGDVIVGVRPGEDTVKYLEKRRRKIALVSSIFLVLIVLVPDMVLVHLGMASLSFMGVSLIILVAAFYDLRLRFTGMTKRWNTKYRLFDTGRGFKKEVAHHGIDATA